ncbi:MAG: hypothetical protein JRH20_07005 [Deltaproteobacteria bacterium]|nr:hypothetical protein [Deltaproteobacteria bacterium]
MHIHRSLMTTSLASLAFFALACSSEQADVSRAQQAAAPTTTAKADGGDSADQSCQVVMRFMNREFGDNAYKTECDDTGCNWVWHGTIEVADSVKDATVQVLYRRSDDDAWWQVQASRTSNLNPSFHRYEVRIHEHLLGPDSSDDTVKNTNIELIPFLQFTDGSRIFDHNRIPGALDTYMLPGDKGFSLQDSATCKPVNGQLIFLPNWDEYRQGDLRQGGYLTMNYDLNRLPQCRGTHNGYPAWDTRAYVRFSPGGEVIEGSVRAFENHQGVPTNVAHATSLAVKVPEDATSVEIWFKNFSGAGSSCVAWDSNLGNNYRYDVWPALDDARCQNIQAWTKQNSDVPYKATDHCIGYDVDAQYAAGHCEFYLDGIGHGFVGHYGIPNRWVEATLKAIHACSRKKHWRGG